MKSDQKKIVKHVQSGSLLKLKSLLEKLNSGRKETKYNLDFKVGEIRRTPLHIACLLGDDAIVRCLLNYGASADIRDANKDTPVHIASQFIHDTGNFPDYKLLLQPLLASNPGVLSYENKKGKTASQIIQDAREKYRSQKKLEEEESDDEKLKKDWNKKLAAEMEAEYCEHTKEFSFDSTQCSYSNDDYQTYDQWADKIFAEYERKRVNTNNRKRKKELQNRKRKEELRDFTAQLLKDHEDYAERAKRMRTEVLNQKRERYEHKMTSLRSEKTTEDKLRFRDIPWPCQGNAAEMVEVLLSGMDAGVAESDKKRCIMRQLVLWHPDKFEQRCGDRLLAKDKDRILDTVKAIAQELNKNLEAIKASGT